MDLRAYLAQFVEMDPEQAMSKKEDFGLKDIDEIPDRSGGSGCGPSRAAFAVAVEEKPAGRPMIRTEACSRCGPTSGTCQ